MPIERSIMTDWRYKFFAIALSAFVCLNDGGRTIAQEVDPLKAYREVSAKWEKDIAEWEEKDKSEVADESSILFLGSSSIRRWTTLSKDMAPWPCVGRGYGGAKFSDLAIYAPRLLAAHHPRGVVIYVGNDITGKPDQDKTPEEVVRLFGIVVDAIQSRSVNTEIFVIAITPAPSRFTAWPEIQTANQQLKAYCEKGKQLHFVETHPYYLTAEGEPRPELYVKDRLHQNDSGYQIWSGIIRKELERVFGSVETQRVAP
jgi:lysophospholipase L1-like esterase